MLNSPKDVGDRFRAARNLSRLNRKDFAEKHDISVNTLHGWELGHYQARGPHQIKYVTALAAEGIVCTPEWLMSAEGGMPHKAAQLLKKYLSNEQTPPDSMKQEALSFAHQQTEAGFKDINLDIRDNAMAPFFEKGDLVAGVLAGFPDDLLNKFCIIKTSPGDFVARRLGKSGPKYLLVPNDLNFPIIEIEQITRAAAIIWHRKPRL